MALTHLGQKQEAEKAFQELKDFILKHKNESPSPFQFEEGSSFMKNVSAAEEQIKKMKDIPKTPKEKTIPAVSFEANPVICQATSALSLRYTAEKGRHTIANRHIPKKSTIIVERPFAAVLLPDHYDSHCHHCFSSLPLTPVGCEQCTTVRFCNEDCREKAWSAYHGTECPYLDLFHSVGIAHLALRVVLIAKLDYLLDFVRNEPKYRKSDEPASKGQNTEGQYDRNYLTVYDLMTHEDVTDSADMLQYSLTSALLLTVLIHSGFFGKIHPAGDGSGEQDDLTNFALGIKAKTGETQQLSQEMNVIGGLLLRHTLQLVCNAHAITALKNVSNVADNGNSQTTRETEQVRIATAIYPTASLLNHSCDPTIVSSFVGDILVNRTTKDVEDGEEIFNCYGPNYCRMKREDRQEVLKSQYHFECKCTRCRGKDVSQERFGAFKCPTCGGVLSGQSCQECFKELQDEALVRLQLRMEQANRIFAEGLGLMKSQNYTDAIQKLEDCLERRCKFLYKDHRDLALVEDAIARCYASIGDYSNSADHLYNSLQFVEQMYGHSSTEYAHELQKTAEVLFNAERFQECLIVANDCLSIFESLYTPGHESIKQITELRDATQFALTPMMQAN